eukprot:3035669-Alexandrium_andersonii.AAC.1
MRSLKTAGVVSVQVSPPTAAGKSNMVSPEQLQSQHGCRALLQFLKPRAVHISRRSARHSQSAPTRPSARACPLS